MEVKRLAAWTRSFIPARVLRSSIPVLTVKQRHSQTAVLDVWLECSLKPKRVG